MVEEGNDILLSKKRGCWITNETGLKIPMRLKAGGTPEFDLWVKRAVSIGRYGASNVEGEADIKDSFQETNWGCRKLAQ